MNISSLQPVPTPLTTWTTIQAQNRDVDFLSLRLLNKRTRVRLSAQPLDLSIFDGRGNFLAIANSRGWFAAVSRSAQGEHALVFSTLKDLRTAITDSKVEGEENLAPRRVLPLAGFPTHLAFCLNEERLMVGFVDGPIAVYDANILFTPGGREIEPLGVFPAVPPGSLRQIIANPADMQQLVAVRREAEGGGDGLAVEILDVKDLRSVGGWKVGSSPDTVPTSISWAPEGQLLAIGLRNGDIVCYDPRDTFSIKVQVPKPPSVGISSVISIWWLTSQIIYGIYAAPGTRDPEAVQMHVITTFDMKTNTATEVQLEAPYFASPALRPPGSFSVVFRNWEPAKFLLFIGDATSSDVGLVGNLVEDGATAETWSNMTLEETSTPGVPLDKEADDTVPLALELDLTDADDSGKPTQPIMYLYASDGTVQSWLVSNERGGMYRGMVSATNQMAVLPPAVQPVEPDRMEEKPAAASAFSAFGQGVPAVPIFGNTGFGQPTAPAFGSTGFGAFAAQKPAAFGQATPVPSMSTTPGVSPFGQTSLGQTSGMSPFAPLPGTGFGAFANQAPTRFGSALGTPSQPAQAPPVAAPETAASPEAEMTDADEGASGGFGGLSLGERPSAKQSGDTPVNSMFGSFPQPKPADAQPSASAGAFEPFGGGGLVRPGIAFGGAVGGAFARLSEAPSASTASATTSTSLEAQKPSPAFGTTGFAAKSYTGFSQPAFGQPAFGQPVFGQPVFGQPSQSQSSTDTSTGKSTPSAFAAFSNAPSTGGFGSFATAAKSSFGDLAKTTAPPVSSTASTSPFGGTSASTLIKPGTGAFGSLSKTSEAQPTTASTTVVPSTIEAVKPSSSFSTTSFSGKTQTAMFDQTSFGQTPFGAEASKTTTTTGGFSSYTDGGGFVSFASGVKTPSFSGLLTTQKDTEQVTPVKSAFPAVTPPAPVKGEPIVEEAKSKEEDGEKAEKKGGEQPVAAAVATATTPAAGEVPCVDVTKLEELDQDNLPPTPSTHGTFDEEDQDLGEEQVELHEDEEQFLSDTLSSEESEGYEEDKVSSEEEGEIDEGAATVPQTPARGAVQSPSTTPEAEPSTTPKAAPPSVNVEDVPSTPARESSKSPSITPESTTPKATPPSLKRNEELPTTPAKPLVSTVESSTPAGPPPSSIFGRPPARPAKSSPLAGAPISAEEKPPAASQSSTTPVGFPKARPASPRPAFGYVPPATTVAAQQETQNPSLFSPQPSTSKTPPTFIGLGSATRPPQLSAFSITPASGPPPFSFPSNVSPSVSVPLPSGDAPFVMPRTPPPAVGAPPTVSSVFPTKPTAFGTVPPQGPASGAAASAPAVAPQQAQQQQAFESGLQRECHVLYQSMNEELEQFKRFGQSAANMREVVIRLTTGPSHKKEDFSNKEKWGIFGDLEVFCQLVKSLDEDITEAYETNKELMPLMREVESNLLKVETRKEEIVRFSKAKADPEFAKMLKARTLGPDAIEAQNQLRKQIRLTIDRVEQLEAHGAECKKRLEEHKRGRHSIKPPSLDTVNRTYRNIDLAIEYHSKQISELTSRIAKLNLDALDSTLDGSGFISRIGRFSESCDQLPTRSDADSKSLRESFRSQVTPSIAASTAAALNAEWSALRLKKALAEVRKVPLVNTQVIGSMSSTATLEKLSQKTRKPPSGVGANASPDVPQSPATRNEILSFSSDLDLTASLESSRRNSRSPAHARSARLNRNHAPIPASITSFDWGPLPGAKPMSTLPSDIRAEAFRK